MTENTAKIVMLKSSGKLESSYIAVKLQDILDPKPEDDRNANDIIEGIRNKLK